MEEWYYDTNCQTCEMRKVWKKVFLESRCGKRTLSTVREAVECV